MIITKLAFQGGAVLDKCLQPHESHIPFILQFMVNSSFCCVFIFVKSSALNLFVIFDELSINRICLICFQYDLSSSFWQIDYNLYGMGHLHLSKMKFRHPVPDAFSPRKLFPDGQSCTPADFQVNPVSCL